MLGVPARLGAALLPVTTNLPLEISVQPVDRDLHLDSAEQRPPRGSLDPLAQRKIRVGVSGLSRRFTATASAALAA